MNGTKGKSSTKSMSGEEPASGQPVFEEPVSAQSAARETIRLVMEQGLTLTTAESCTGGMLASAITSVPGVSAVYPGGFVTYCDEFKHRLLGVSKKYLKKNGAISRGTAKRMAKGAAKKAGTDIAVSVTGNAGPDAQEDKPVGLVYIGLYCDGATEAEKFVFEGSRQEIREAACLSALQMLYQRLS